ncbi:hypothetical protein EPD60_02425 [Flaviaesturariibacter flavus]|uniref:Uncharacterized protein n=1 Tax=Flaviaesturariibacter flavus TaxID=2502780 RepID=A0A4R1BNW0_9BACT|nr:hypothetical protein [Flaviaesturariibacter flavus]TCJ19293.1 hypothetical protein EPD60_02425 [Flaviaesturariibacter flavus]
MKKSGLLFLLLIVVLGGQLRAQKIANSDLRTLRAKEDSLKKLVQAFYMDDDPAVRLRSDSQFVRTLVRSLQVRHSFQYPFDSVLGVGHIYAPDSTFRIFTWAINIPGTYQRKRGAIQMRTADGSLKLLPLRDVTEFTERPEDSVRGRDNWIGAVYYNMVKTEWNGKKFYTLFGLDDYGISTKRKWVEVLTFDEGGQPRFGGNYFDFSKDSVPRKSTERFYIAYKKEASTLVNWVDEQDMILYDHLISETNQPDLPYTMIPDGDSEGFKWENGRWVHIDKVFHYKIDMSGADPLLGKPPMGEPLLDGKGNVDEEKLKVKTEKNRKKDQD